MGTKPLYLTEKVIDEILIEDIYDDEGNILMARNAIINEYAFNILAKSNIDKITIYPSKNSDCPNKRTNLPIFHKENILALQEIVTRLAAGKGIDPNELNRVSETLSVEVMKSSQMVGQAVKTKDTDEYTYNHSINVAIYSLYIGKLIGLEKERIKELCQAALLHDIGKSKVPKDILNKKGKLTEEEFEIVKNHTIDGYMLSKKVSFIGDEVREAILSHHEREDGSGYPRGINSSKINLYAKILAIADVYDALTSERSYKEKSTPFDAIEEFYNMGINKFSKPLLNIFLKNTSQLYINSKVKLSDGRIGRIQFINPKELTKPVIRVNGEHINLSKYLSLKVEEVIG